MVTVVVTTTVDPLSVVVNDETMISGIEVVKMETLVDAAFINNMRHQSIACWLT